MSILVASGKGASIGVLFKNADALERLARVDTLVIDKTGTLTEGKPKLTALVPSPGVEEHALLRWAASLERLSEHPLAKAVVEAAQERGVELGTVTGFESITGQGVRGSIDQQSIALGNRSLLEASGGDPSALSRSRRRVARAGANRRVHRRLWKARWNSGDFRSYQGQPCGQQSRRSKERPSASDAHLHDARHRIGAVARQLGIQEVIADVLPDRKAQAIERLQKEGRVIAMAGDGINDAPALARADVGIAMGTGTDVAIESAGITLVKGDLNGILRARTLSRLLP